MFNIRGHIIVVGPNEGYACINFAIGKRNSSKLRVKKHKDCTNVDVRAGCKAFILFHINEDEKWIVTWHESEHNHPLCSPSTRHLLASHEKCLSRIFYL